MTGKFAATLAYKAFIAARKELVNVADSDATGFRSHDVPVVYFVLSDVSLCTCVCLMRLRVVQVHTYSPWYAGVYSCSRLR